MDNGLIIVIDADVRHLDSVCDLLTAHGLEVMAADTGSAALARVAEHHADVLILDLLVPGMSGIELMQRMHAEHPDVKVIVVSGDPSSTHVAPVLRYGAYEYLAKPYRPEQLVTSVRNALAQRRLEADNRRMHDQVHQSDQLHRYLVEKSPDLIYMLDSDGHFTFANERAEQILHCDRDALLGRHWSLLFDAPGLDEALHRFNERRTGERATHDVELRVRCLQPAADGSHAYLELTAMGVYRASGADLVFSGTYGVARDITAKKTTEDLLEESQQRFRELFEVSPDPVFISRVGDGAVVESNANYRRLAGQIEGGQATGNDGILFAQGSGRDDFMERLRRNPAGATFDAELRVGGQLRFFNIKARLVGDENDGHMLATLRDLTDHRRAEHDRLELEALLQDARKIITVGQISGGIAHDFNNILASMIGYTELAQMPSSDDPQVRREHLSQVIEAGQRARDLVAQLLSFSRTDTSDAHAVNVGTVIADNLGLLRAALPRSIDIDADVGDTLPPVFIDPMQLRQVLISLFLNASEAMEGTGTVTLRARRADIDGIHCASCQQPVSGDYVALEVADSGRGLQPDLQHMFELFVTSPTGSQSSGVGLALVHRIVHEYNGHVAVLDNAGRGTRFTLMLPLVQPDAVPSTPRVRRAREPVGRILVVDDEVSVSSFVADALRACGHRVVVFNDAPTALEFARENPAGVSLCVTDQSMPQLTGFELARALKQVNPAIGVVLITGYADVARDVETRREEIDGFLPKPFRMDELIRVVEDLLVTDPMDAACEPSD